MTIISTTVGKNLIQMTTIYTIVGKNPIEEME